MPDGGNLMTFRYFLLGAALAVPGLLTACVSGVGAPDLVASAAFVDFGVIAPGGIAEGTVSISNAGDAAAEVALPTISGVDDSVFEVAGGTWPTILEPGGSIAVELSFSPTDEGSWTATLSFGAGLSGAISGGGGGSSATLGSSVVSVALIARSEVAGDDDDSAGDDDDTAGDDDDSAGDDDDTAGDDDDTAGDDDDTTGDDDDTAGDDDDEIAGPDEDGDGYVAESAGGTDCDDADPTVSPAGLEFCDGIDSDCNGFVDDAPLDGSTWHLDADSDGYGGQLLTQEACTAPASYVANTDDCNDLDGAVYPGATELCNGVDDDCDGEVDDNAPAAQTWYLDNDGDGVGGFWLTQEACSMPQGYAGDSSDCDDTNAAIYPQAPELCDGDDNDCDGNLGGDEIDDDGDGVTECSLDCDDADPLRFPGSAELCDGIDNDCDATTTAVGDELDADSDTSLSCEDCDDDPVTGPAVYPGADEVCDGVDNDCDGTADVGASNETTWYFDADGDTYGGFLLTQQACSAPTGYVASSNDCAELDPNSYPGAHEVCDGVDNDCNTLVDDGTGATGTVWYADTDADGYGDGSGVIGTFTTACSQPTGYVSNSLDCDDSNAATNPTSYEICDGVDNNCVDGIDEAGALNATNWYVDDDGDGFGVAGTPVSSCTQPQGYADNTADCNDDVNNGGADIHPNASEICNTIDDDCDGTPDDGAVDATLWYLDNDGDGYGNVASGTLSCTQLGGTVQDATDCDDTEASINPQADEICDGQDNDCDGSGAEFDPSSDLGIAGCPGESCKDILDTRSPSPGDGVYWLDPVGDGPFQAYCDMSSHGGGWTLVIRAGYGRDLTTPDLTGDFLPYPAAPTDPGTGVLEKMSDSLINSLRTETGPGIAYWVTTPGSGTGLFGAELFHRGDCTFALHQTSSQVQATTCHFSTVNYSMNPTWAPGGHWHDNSSAYRWAFGYANEGDHGTGHVCHQNGTGLGPHTPGHAPFHRGWCGTGVWGMVFVR